jgi:Linalool dehydratase/isomerase
MHAWNPDFVKANYPRHIERWSKEGPDGTLWIEPAIPPVGFGKELSNALDLGWAAACASEVGDSDTLQRLLAYADQFLNPVWHNGAYFYQRRDGWFDQEGRLSAMDPHTGNALLAYARLNVPDGLRKLYGKPWNETHFREPALVDMPDDLDVCAAQYDEDSTTLWLNMRANGNQARTANIGISNVWDRGDWTLQLDGEIVASGTATAPRAGSGIAMRREGGNLLVACPISPAADLRLTWH